MEFARWRTIAGQKYSFHALMNRTMPSAASAGRRLGTTTVHSVDQEDRPSMRAASSSSLGKLSMCWRSNRTLSAVHSVGMTTPASVFSRPSRNNSV